MARYRDFLFKQGDFVKLEEVTDNVAIIMAIKNIMLSRPGNFPMSPQIGMNIGKYQFDLLDQRQIDIIRSELVSQVSQLIPDISTIDITVEIVRDETGQVNSGNNMLGIYVSSSVDGQSVGTGFLMYEESGTVQVIDNTII